MVGRWPFSLVIAVDILSFESKKNISNVSTILYLLSHADGMVVANEGQKYPLRKVLFMCKTPPELN